VKIPKNLAKVADMFYEARQARLELEKTVKPLAEKEKILREHLIQNVPKSQIGGIQGAVCRVEVGTKPVPKIEDMAKFRKFCSKKGNEDLLKIGLDAEAVRLRWADNKEVPGVERFNIVTLSYSKVKGKK